MASPAWFARLADDATWSFSFRSPAWSTTGLPCRPWPCWSCLIHLYSKLGVHNRTQAVARATRLLG